MVMLVRMVASAMAMAMVTVVMMQTAARRADRSHGARTRRVVAEEGTLLGPGPGGAPRASGRVGGLEVASTVVVVAAGVVVLLLRLLLVAGPDSQAGGDAVGGAVGAVVVARHREGEGAANQSRIILP